MESTKKQQLLDAIFDNPSLAFPDFDWQPNTYGVGRYGANTSRIHVDENNVYGRESSDHNPRQTYIKDGSTDKHAIIVDVNGASIEVFKAWEVLHGEQYPWQSLFELYHIEPPQRDPEQVKREQKQKTDTDTLLSDIRRDFLQGDAGKDVRDYLTRPIEQGGRGWNADTLSAMADYMGVVTEDTDKKLSNITGLYFSNATAKTHPIVIYTFDKNGRLQYMKRRAIGDDKEGGEKWGNIDSKKSGRGLTDVFPFNYNRVSFLSATSAAHKLIVVESELCAAHATVAGIQNVVAISGSQGIQPKFAHHIVATGCNEIILIYDTEGDNEHQEKTDNKLLRTIKGLREQVERLKIRVATIPAELNAKDPDELLSRRPNDGAAILQGIIDNAPTATQWMAKRYADKYDTATTDEERQRIEYDVINQSVELKNIGGLVAVEGDRLTATFCSLSGTVIDAETMAQAANEKAMQTARDEFNKTRDKLLTEYDDARKKGDNEKAADILDRIGHLTEPQGDPELNQSGKTFDDIARELYIDETANIATSYQVNVSRRDRQFEQQPVILPANGITYVAGGTGHGKSTLLQNIAYDLLKQGKRVLYYGFEEVKRDTIFEFVNIMVHDKRHELLELSRDGSTQGINRYLKTQKTDVFSYRTWDTQKGYGNADNEEEDPDKREKRDTEIKLMQSGIAEIIHGFFKYYRGMDGGQQTLFVYDDTFTSAELVEHIARIAPVVRPDAIFIDYIQFLQSDPNNTKAAQWEDLGKVSKDLIRINKTHQIPVVAAAQLNERGINLSSPDQLNYTHIFGASAIAQGASAVYVLGKGSRYPDGCKVTYCGQDETPFEKYQMWLKCVKNRFGEDGGQAIYKFDGAKRYIDPESLVLPDKIVSAPKNSNNKGTTGDF